MNIQHPYTKRAWSQLLFTLLWGFAIPANGRKTIDASRRICTPYVLDTST